MREIFFNGRINVKTGDITEEATDAIVNAANWTLLGGAGVDGAIHSKGGPQILAECRKIRETAFSNGLPTGMAVITSGGDLPARHVIHTVGPIYGMNQGKDAELLAACYKNSLQLAALHGLKSIAFPSVSTGAFAYPKHEAARIASAAISDAIIEIEEIEVRMVFFSVQDARMFLKHSVFG